MPLRMERETQTPKELNKSPRRKRFHVQRHPVPANTPWSSQQAFVAVGLIYYKRHHPRIVF
jgi:hypothetical protein